MLTLIRGGVVLREKDGVLLTEKADVLVKDNKITAVGDVDENVVVDRLIDASDKLVLPGLINTHTHSYMTLLRNYGDDLPFGEWLFQRVMPREEKLTSQDGYWGALLACCEMLMTGTTCFLDMHMFPNEIAKAVCDSGIRGVLSRGLSGGNDESGQRRLREAAEDMERYANQPRLSFQMGPHAIYTCDHWLLRTARDEAEKRNIPLHIHLSESRQEVADCLKAHGCTPTVYLERLGVLDVPVLAAHCVHMTDEDLDILAKHHVTVLHNPISNLKLANGVAPVPKMLERGIRVTLGTDGCASNNALNLFRDMGVCATIHKGVNENAVAVTARDTVNFVTKNGAAALQKPDLGAVEPGKTADLVLMNLKQPCFMPPNDLVSSLCYSASGNGVDTVLVDGQIVVEKGVPTLVDMEQLYSEIKRIAAQA